MSTTILVSMHLGEHAPLDAPLMLVVQSSARGMEPAVHRVPVDWANDTLDEVIVSLLRDRYTMGLWPTSKHVEYSSEQVRDLRGRVNSSGHTEVRRYVFAL